MTMPWVSLAATLFFSSTAYGNLSATAGVASVYLYRGLDASAGKPEVFGDLNYRTANGFYGSLWGSSAKASVANSHEYNIIVGWQQPIDSFDINIGAISYVYPGLENSKVLHESEVYAGMGWRGFAFYIYDNVASKELNNEGYYYLALSYTSQQIDCTLGYATDDKLSSSLFEDGEYSYAHIDLTYAFNDKLSFTFSQVIDQSAKINGVSINESEYDLLASRDGRFSVLVEDDLLFVVSYNLPIIP